MLAWGRSVARELIVPGREEPVAIPVRAGDAAALARDLARLIDDFETEARDFSGLAALVADNHAQYWAITLAFLKIVTEQWPAFLDEHGLSDPVTRRDALLRLEAARLARTPQRGPVIAAGSTGSIPATAELLGVIARLPHGAVVLPGLDLGMDEESWAALDDAGGPHPGHPQYGLKRLLDRIGATRGLVETLGGPVLPERELLVSEAFRPVATTERWADMGARLGDAARERGVGGLRLVETAGEQEEATSIALMMREAIDTPGRTAALVTPDRGLARRVSAELGRWDLTVDDSAGVPLADTVPGTLFRLIAEAAAARLAPVSLVALLQHPLATFGLAPEKARPAARALELVTLRGLRPRPGSEGLARIVAHRLAPGPDDMLHPAVRRAISEQGPAILDLCARIVGALEPLETLGEQGEVRLADLVAAHEAALAAVGGEGAREGEAGRALSDFLDALMAGDGGLELPLEEYPALLSGLMAGRVVRPTRPGHPRLQILGPIEARLLSASLVILGGLNEGTWPADTRADPFLNRPMRADAGLEAPERFIGLAAHDVASLMSQPNAALVRAAKLGGEPTVASRWLQRLEAVAGKTAYRRIAEAGADYAAWARDIDLADGRDEVAEPQPRPDPAVRPRALSITEIETLIRDPYAVYAKHVLKLRPLDALDEAPDAATRGTMIHDALSRFDDALASGNVADPVATLVAIGEEVFAGIDDHPELRAVWWPRFLRVARWFAPLDAMARAGLSARHVEVSGELPFNVDGERFVLRGRADRIERHARRARRGGRLQDRKRPHRQTGRERAQSPAPAGGGDDTRWRLRGRAGADRHRGLHLCRTQGRARTGQGCRDRAEGHRCRYPGARDARQARRHAREIRPPADALPRQDPCPAAPLGHRLRPPFALCRMERRGRRGGTR